MAMTWLLGTGATLAKADETVRLLTGINRLRTEAGLGLLADNPHLRSAAQAHGADLKNCGLLSHTGCDGSRLDQRLHWAGYAFTAAAENLAQGTAGADATLAAWINSPGHRQNLLRPDLTEAGMFHGTLGQSDLWVLVLASPALPAPRGSLPLR